MLWFVLSGVHIQQDLMYVLCCFILICEIRVSHIGD